MKVTRSSACRGGRRRAVARHRRRAYRPIRSSGGRRGPTTARSSRRRRGIGPSTRPSTRNRGPPRVPRCRRSCDQRARCLRRRERPRRRPRPRQMSTMPRDLLRVLLYQILCRLSRRSGFAPAWHRWWVLLGLGRGCPHMHACLLVVVDRQSVTQYVCNTCVRTMA